MLRFLLASPKRGRGPFSDAYIAQLKVAFAVPDAPDEDEGRGDAAEHGGTPMSRWLLDRVEATGFGGVTAYGAGSFTLEFGGRSLCLDGLNGQGKTSLASLLTVALTGQRIGAHGPSAAACSPHPVRTASGGGPADGWPPVVTYPRDLETLQSAVPEAMIRLVFKDEAGLEHTTERTVTRGGISPAQPFLPPGVSPLHAELAVLIPNRVAHVRVTEERRLVEVLVELIGLEPLQALGEHASDLCHGSKNFAGYPKTADIRAAAGKAEATLKEVLDDTTARDALPPSPTPPNGLQPGDLSRALVAAKAGLTGRKSQLFQGVEVDPSIDLTRADGLSRVQRLLGEVAALLGENLLKSLPSMSAVKQIAALAEPARLEVARRALSAAREALAFAREAAARQRRDAKLRLKATAARWHAENHPDSGGVDDCPLCGRTLSGDADLDALAAELAALKTEGEVVTRTFGEACNRIAQELAADLARLGNPVELPPDPVADVLDELARHLEASEPLGLILPTPRRSAVEAVRSLARTRSPGGTPLAVAGVPEEERAALDAIARAERAITLAEAWPEAKVLLGRVRQEIIGRSGTDGSAPAVGTLLHALRAAQDASDSAAPIDKATERLDAAMAASEALRTLQEEHRARRAVVEALTPLKDLIRVVQEEAREALAEVSAETVELFGRIYAGGPLALQGAGMPQRGALRVEGRVGDAVVDASLVANTSWLRAFLWAFVFTLRRQAVARLGYDPMPLLLLDDPQATLDNCNERQWAGVLAEMSAGTDGRPAEAQLVITSHDLKFFERDEFKSVYDGSRGAVHGICPAKGTLRVFHGGPHDRAWDALNRDQTPGNAQAYISEVRMLVEGKLSLILQIFGVISNQTDIQHLINEFETRRSLPFFTSPAVLAVTNLLRTERTFRSKLNASHHDEDRRSLTVHDAREVNAVWRRLDETLEGACAQARRLEFLYPRQAGSSSVVAFPTPNRLVAPGRVRDRELVLSGRVAAATGGRVTWGNVDSGEKVRLVRHGSVRLLADTLAPIARPGDLLLLRQFGDPADGDLVVAEVDGQLRARRLRMAGEDRSSPTLLAESAGDRSLPPLILAAADNRMRIVDGVLYSQPDGTGGARAADEAAAVDHEVDVLDHAGSGASVWKVAGDSAAPVALDGQFLLAGPRARSPEELRRLDGCFVLAEVQGPTDEPERYFKRLRLAPPVAVLESIEPTGDFGPVVCSLVDGHTLPPLIAAAPIGCVHEFWPSSADEFWPTCRF
jgi:SOS-response transcriptional repressor LexA